MFTHIVQTNICAIRLDENSTSVNKSEYITFKNVFGEGETSMFDKDQYPTLTQIPMKEGSQ
jgi:hypothetical protein